MMTDHHEVVPTVQAMLQQEESVYHCCDCQQEERGDENQALNDYRVTMTEWQYKVVDYMNYSQENVAVAASYLDRFLQTEHASQARQHRETFQVACVSCLYMAIKLQELRPMPARTFSSLSHGIYSTDEIEAMEAKVLKALEWRVNPPTAMSFVRYLLALLPHNQMGETIKHAVFDLAQLQTELAVKDSKLSKTKASTIALASLLNAFDSLGFDERFCWQLAHEAGIVKEEGDISRVKNALYHAIAEQPHLTGFTKGTPSPSTSSTGVSLEKASCEQHSPRSVQEIRRPC